METLTSNISVSISVSLSKIPGVEDISKASIDDALNRQGSGAEPEMISNEEIKVDDEFLET